ncbi:MAG: hypothetical protein AAGE52_01420 [Myxococcota bacterium]
MKFKATLWVHLGRFGETEYEEIEADSEEEAHEIAKEHLEAMIANTIDAGFSIEGES